MSKNVSAGKRGFIYDPATTSLDLMADGVIVSKYGSDAEIKGIYEESATQLYEIGTRRALSDGRVFRYCYAGNALWMGMGAHDGSTPALFTLAVSGGQAAGEAYLTVPDTDATHTANYWKDGYVSVEGYGPWMRRIVSSTASDGSTCNLYLDTVLPAAVTTNNVQVVRNPYANCQKITTAAQAKLSGFVCVPPLAVTSGYYFWGQTWGPCSGCPADFFGDLEFERAVCFMDTDGAIQSGQRGEAGSKYYQIAGYLMGNYTAATDHRIPIYFLTLAP
jgi:hypothetical protein